MIINGTAANVYKVTRNNSIGSFLKIIQKYPVLDTDEELDLIIKYKENHDMAARDKLVYCNQRFIFSAAKRFSSNPDTIMDLVDEGTYGFIISLDEYDVTRGMKLLTFAKEYVRKYMMMYILKNNIVQKLSDEKFGTKISRERSLFYNQNGRYPVNEELKEILFDKYGIDIKKDVMLNDITYNYIDDTETEEDLYTKDTTEFNLATASSNDFIKKQEKDDTKSIVLAGIERVCKPKEAKIIKLLYGIDADREYSASEVAMMLDMTETRITQIKRNVERKLRENKQFMYLVSA